jgi:hypothetical protein
MVMIVEMVVKRGALEMGDGIGDGVGDERWCW